MKNTHLRHPHRDGDMHPHPNDAALMLYVCAGLLAGAGVLAMVFEALRPSLI